MSLIERAIAKLAAANPQPVPTATPKHEPKLPPATNVRPTVRLVPKPPLTIAPLPTSPLPISTLPTLDDDEVLTKQIERIESVEEAETLIDDRPHEYSASRNSAKRVAITSDVLRAQGFITLERARTRVAHQFRVIKRVLIDNALQRSGEKLKHTRRIMITSALPGEGKTYCSINLAITLAAERNLRVLLVDADFARPGIMNALGLQAGPGLTDWLRGDEESPAELILPTNIRGLSLMPSGSTLRNTTELLSSSRCARRLRQLEAMLRNYIVLFDTSPLLPTIESLALSRHMGQVVLVVEADKTPRQAVGEACAMLSDHPSVALLLNKQKFKDGSDNYGYGKYKRESD